MNMDERIARINELYHKSQRGDLSAQEKEEQVRLRKEYVETSGLTLRDSWTISLLKGLMVRKRILVKNMGTSKRDIRKAVLLIRDELGVRERERAALLLTERILGHQWFYRAESVLCFASFGSEISTWEILREALRQGKRVYVPKVLQEKIPQMCFYRIMGLEELREGYKGIMEPPGDSAEYTYTPEAAEHTLMLMPGVAFDGCRNRIGYGLGFYDRFLSDKPCLGLHTIAVGYKCQLVEEVPASPTDIKPYQVICV